MHLVKYVKKNNLVENCKLRLDRLNLPTELLIPLLLFISSLDMSVL